MRPCVRRFVTTFSSSLDRETSVVHSRQQGAGGFVGAQVSRAGRRPRPSRRRQRPVGIERPRGQALPEDAGAGGGEDAGGTGNWASPWYEVDVLDGPGPQRVQSRFDARGWSPTGRAAMETLLEAGAARGQRYGRQRQRSAAGPTGPRPTDSPAPAGPYRRIRPVIKIAEQYLCRGHHSRFGTTLV